VKNIVGIAACPTGLAHTYMAAEAIEEAGKKLGYNVKMETQGSGEQNKLTDEEIKNADLIIMAVDRKVDYSRFAGRSVLITSTSNAIKNAETVIKNADAGIGLQKIDAGNGATNPNSVSGKGYYKHLMSGINLMLPFVVVGGILIACSFAFGIHAFDSTDPSYNPIAGALFNIGSNSAFALMNVALAVGISYSVADKPAIVVGAVAGFLAKNGGSGFIGAIIGGSLAGYLTKFLIDKIKVSKNLEALKGLVFVPLLASLITGFAMIFVINTPIQALLTAISNWLSSIGESNALLLGALLGAMMTFDMGGPVNKAASLFYLGLMDTGIYGPAAACMCAGMIPPLGMALATTINKHRFTIDEREAGKTCWVLGASYITEGVIPFAVADPKAVFPANMLGGMVGAAICMASGVQSLAPHGGLFVLAIPHVITNLPMFLVALVAGSLTSCAVVSLLKKKKYYD